MASIELRIQQLSTGAQMPQQHLLRSPCCVADCIWIGGRHMLRIIGFIYTRRKHFASLEAHTRYLLPVLLAPLLSGFYYVDAFSSHRPEQIFMQALVGQGPTGIWLDVGCLLRCSTVTLIVLRFPRGVLCTNRMWQFVTLHNAVFIVNVHSFNTLVPWE